VDDAYEMYPELKEQIMEDIKRDNWGTSIKDMEIYAEELRREKEEEARKRALGEGSTHTGKT
jgi:hypothetical protein